MTQQADAIIEVDGLSARYGAHTVLDGVSFRVRRGEIFVILGGSGSGKSTLLRNLVGLMRPAAGRIVLNSQDFTAMDEAERLAVRKKMGMCFQGSALLNSMTVLDNVALPLREHTRLKSSTIDIMARIKLELVGLGRFGRYYPPELSGGMRKRAGVARAMAMDPEIICYDEPSAGLDPVVAAGVDKLIRKMQQTFHLTSVVVTHELASVDLIADTVCVLHDGQVLAIGPPDEVKRSSHPYVQQFFSRQPEAEVSDNNEYIRSITQL